MTRRVRRPYALARRLTAAAFLAALAGAPFVRGSITSTTWFGILPFADPLAAAEVALASRQIAAPLLVGATVTAGAAVLLGPVFCGWLCPLGLLFDLNQALRERARRVLARRRRKLPSWGLPRSSRLCVLGACLAASLGAAIPVFQTVSPINVLVWTVRFGGAGAAVVGLLLAAEWLAPRVFCRGICPTGAAYSLLGRWSLLRVRVALERAGRTPCHQCTLRCPMGIEVMEQYAMRKRPSVDHPDCTRCGSCVDACPGGVLSLGISPRYRPTARTRSPRTFPTSPTCSILEEELRGDCAQHVD